MRRRTLHGLFLTAIATVAMLAGCGRAPTETPAVEEPGATVEEPGATVEEPGAPRTLVAIHNGDPILDPGTEFITWSYTFHRNVYDPLVQYEAGTAVLEPWLATEWQANEDLTEWTFSLREGVIFHDGDTFDAEDVVTTFTRVMALNQGQPGGVLQGKLESVEAIDDMTVVFRLNVPYALFPAMLPKIGIISSEDVAEHQVNGDWAQPWFSENENGAGPYRMVEMVRGDHYTLERFGDWWNADAFNETAYDRVIVRMITDSAVQRQLIESGQACLGANMTVRDMIGAAQSSSAELADSESWMTFEMVVNAGLPPMDSLLVRQAMVLAFPYERFQEYYQGYSEVPHNILSIYYPGADQSYGPMEQDLERAAELLAEAGYPNGGFTVTYTAVEGLEDERQAGLLFQDALAGLGVTLEMQVLPFSTYFEAGFSPETAATFNPHYEAPETADPFQWFDKMFGTGGLLNWTYQDTSAMDEIIDRGQAEPDPGRRVELLHQAQALATEQVYNFPVSNFRELDILCGDTGGFVYQPTDLMYVPRFWQLYQQP